MINRKLFIWSNITGIALILGVLGITFLYNFGILSHEGVDFTTLQKNGIFSGSVWEGSLGENNVTSTRESLEITTEVKGV